MGSLELGPTPHEEPCEQVGDNYNPIQAKRECRAFINQLKRMFGECEGARFVITSNPHDFGSYFEVVVKFNNNEQAIDYAFMVEEKCPARWDEEAKLELHITDED